MTSCFGCLSLAIVLILVLPFHPLGFLFLIAAVILYRRRGDREVLHFSLVLLGLLLLNLVFQDRFPLYLVAGALAVAVFGSEVFWFSSQRGWDDARGSLLFLATGSVLGFVAAGWVDLWTEGGFAGEFMFFLAVLGSIVGALLYVTARGDRVLVMAGAAMTMWLFFAFTYYRTTGNLVLVLIFSLVLGYLAYRMEVADTSAMLSATLLGVVIITFAGFEMFGVLLAFFILGGVFTRYKYREKSVRGIAQENEGARGYKNVFSNSLPALAIAVAYRVYPGYSDILLLAYLGSVATATGDTLASEIGQTFRGEPRMITSLRKVPPGTDGAVSSLGEAAALGGSLAITFLAIPLVQGEKLIPLAVVAVSGFLGTNLDSLLGATLQQRGVLSNNGVNLAATTLGALLSAALSLWLGL